jgi:hypothetical protein
VLQLAPLRPHIQRGFGRLVESHDVVLVNIHRPRPPVNDARIVRTPLRLDIPGVQVHRDGHAERTDHTDDNTEKCAGHLSPRSRLSQPRVVGVLRAHRGSLPSKISRRPVHHRPCLQHPAHRPRLVRAPLAHPGDRRAVPPPPSPRCRTGVTRYSAIAYPTGSDSSTNVPPRTASCPTRKRGPRAGCDVREVENGRIRRRSGEAGWPRPPRGVTGQRPPSL